MKKLFILLFFIVSFSGSALAQTQTPEIAPNQSELMTVEEVEEIAMRYAIDKLGYSPDYFGQNSWDKAAVFINGAWFVSLAKKPYIDEEGNEYIQLGNPPPGVYLTIKLEVEKANF